MIDNSINIRVRYSETDQMQYVYYGNYAAYFEMGRVEWLRNMGFSYKDLETSGIMLPVIEMNIKYHKPALYDDLLTLKTTLVKLPKVKVVFDFEIYNQKNELLNTARTTLVFWDMKRNRPTKAPQDFLDKLEAYF
jgi:acyl-CoA thioester hydrolase